MRGARLSVMWNLVMADRDSSPVPSDPQYFLIREAQIEMWNREIARGLRLEVTQVLTRDSSVCLFYYFQQEIRAQCETLTQDLARLDGGNIAPEEWQRKQQQLEKLQQKHLSIYVARLD